MHGKQWFLLTKCIIAVLFNSVFSHINACKAFVLSCLSNIKYMKQSFSFNHGWKLSAILSLKHICTLANHVLIVHYCICSQICLAISRSSSNRMSNSQNHFKSELKFRQNWQQPIHHIACIHTTVAHHSLAGTIKHVYK